MDRPTTTLYLRGMPIDVVRDAKATAARRGCTLSTVVTGALERGLADDFQSPHATARPQDDLALAMDWFESNRASLQRKLPGEYVAIIDGAVADHDPDFEQLASRVFARSGVRSVFMPRVEPAGRTIQVRSPRRVRA